MRLDDRVECYVVSERPTAPAYGSKPIDFGYSAVSLLSVNYNIEQIGASQAFHSVGISRNPEHENNPPGDIQSYLRDNDIYAKASWMAIQRDAGTEGRGVSLGTSTIEVNTHGLLIPKRQIIVWCLIYSGSVAFSAEFYYRPVEMSRAELDSLNLRYGKYRRHG